MRHEIVRPTSVGHEVAVRDLHPNRAEDLRPGDWVLADSSDREPRPGTVLLVETASGTRRLLDAGQLAPGSAGTPGEPTLADEVRIIGRVYGRLRFSEVH